MADDDRRPSMPLGEALATIRQVAAALSGGTRVCACCGQPLDSPADGDLCGTCQIAGCRPLLGQAWCQDGPESAGVSGVTGDDLGDIPQIGGAP